MIDEGRQGRRAKAQGEGAGERRAQDEGSGLRPQVSGLRPQEAAGRGRVPRRVPGYEDPGQGRRTRARARDQGRGQGEGAGRGHGTRRGTRVGDKGTERGLHSSVSCRHRRIVRMLAVGVQI